MKFREWIETNGFQKKHIAKLLKIQKTYLSRILREGTVNLRVALDIEKLTKGQVRCTDLLPSEQPSKQQLPSKEQEELDQDLNKTYADRSQDDQNDHCNDSNNVGA